MMLFYQDELYHQQTYITSPPHRKPATQNNVYINGTDLSHNRRADVDQAYSMSVITHGHIIVHQVLMTLIAASADPALMNVK